MNYYKCKTDNEVYIILPTKEKSHCVTEGNITIYYDTSLYIPRGIRVSQKETVERARSFSELVETIITKHDINIISAENLIFGTPAAYSLLLNMVANIHKIPLVLRLHMFPTTELQIALTTQLLWSRLSCVSKSVASICFEKGADIEKLSTDYLGVNIENFNPTRDPNYQLRKKLHIPEDAVIVLTASRILRGETNILGEKGIINLIQSFSKLAFRYPKLHLLIGVGKAPENLKTHFASVYEMLLGYIKMHNIEDRTTVRLFELDEMPNVYKDSDLFVLTSEHNETFGQTFIESMACGVPVIGANTGGIPEIISDSYNGYLVAPNDSSILTQRIESILKDEVLKDKFIKAGIKTVEEKFTSDSQFLAYHKMLEEIVY
ncbi:glycosyltransferase family 4 protein [Candidatus Roizmanbacteria bacterium]|nr:glycosyltransferase family 4 protein [Candidatus Roizmanbacteria bacterium]